MPAMSRRSFLTAVPSRKLRECSGYLLSIDPPFASATRAPDPEFAVLDGEEVLRCGDVVLRIAFPTWLPDRKPMAHSSKLLDPLRQTAHRALRQPSARCTHPILRNRQVPVNVVAESSHVDDHVCGYTWSRGTSAGPSTNRG